jgi:transposase InsO family protein
VADNLLNQNFNPVGPNQIWAGDITYLLTGEGWMYLAIVMDLYSRRIVRWFISKRMTTDLISKAMVKAYNLRSPPKDWCFTVIVDLNTPAGAIVNCLKVTVHAPVWAMSERVGTMQW